MTSSDSHHGSNRRDGVQRERGQALGNAHWARTHAVFVGRQQVPGIRTVPTCANALRTLASGDETPGMQFTKPKEALELELATRCGEGTWRCVLELAGC
jgi:hypothetical protein